MCGCLAVCVEVHLAVHCVCSLAVSLTISLTASQTDSLYMAPCLACPLSMCHIVRPSIIVYGRSVLLFTGCLLCADGVLCAAMLQVHIYRLISGSDGESTVGLLVMIDAVAMYAYPGVIAALFYCTATDERGVAIIANRRVDASFIVYVVCV